MHLSVNMLKEFDAPALDQFANKVKEFGLDFGVENSLLTAIRAMKEHRDGSGLQKRSYKHTPGSVKSKNQKTQSDANSDSDADEELTALAHVALDKVKDHLPVVWRTKIPDAEVLKGTYESSRKEQPEVWNAVKAYLNDKIPNFDQIPAGRLNGKLRKRWNNCRGELKRRAKKAAKDQHDGDSTESSAVPTGSAATDVVKENAQPNVVAQPATDAQA